MSSFIQFRNSRRWTAERNPDINNSFIEYDFIQLKPNEFYTQSIKVIPEMDSLRNLKLIDCFDNLYDVDLGLFEDLESGYTLLEFKLLDDYGNIELRLTDGSGWYSNPFVCTEDYNCQTAIVHYRDPDVYCKNTNNTGKFESIRLKLKFVRYETANEVEENYELSSNNLVTTTQNRKYIRWKLIANSLVGCCFNDVSEKVELYFNYIRQVLKESYELPEFIGVTNCGESEFLTDERDDDVLSIPIRQLVNFDNETCTHFNMDCNNFQIIC